MAQTVKKKRRKKKKKTSSAQPLVVVLMLLLLLFFALLIIYRVFTGAIGNIVAHDPSVPTATPVVTAPPTLPPSTLVAECFGTENGFKTYRSEQGTAQLGLDVSAHQGWIDWNAVAESDVDFVILRAGYRGYGSGSVHADEYFEYNISAATATDLGVGIYFFSQALTPEEAASEAQTVLDMIAGYDVDFPIYFDWEPVSDEDARTATISASEVTACAKSFCQVIEDAGYTAGIYFNLTMAANYYHLYDLKDYEFWLAEYSDVPSFPFAIDIWQYTASGTVPGIDVNVDLNLRFTSNGS